MDVTLALLAASSELVLVVRPPTRLAFVSPAAVELMGWPAASMPGTDLLDLVHPEEQEAVGALLERVQRGQQLDVVFGCRLRHRDGSWRQHDLRAVDRADAPGVQGVVVHARDVTEWRELEAQLTRQALHDPLTGLGNRALFEAHLARSLALQHRDRRQLALLLVDLDEFKDVNDSLGHVAGDQLLVEVAQRLQASVRTGDVVTRLGGDEFAVLCEDVDDDTVEAIAERTLRCLRAPLNLEGRQVFATASIGVALAHDPGLSEGELLRNADAALYAAKESGRDQWARYTEDLQHDALTRLQVHSELREAVEREQFRLVYQPIVALRTGAPVSHEALLRWNHPRRGTVGPDDFIPAAETAGLIGVLGRWVLLQACAAAAVRHARGTGPASISVNVSPRQFRDDLVGDVVDALAATGLPPRLLTLEITEGVMLGNPDRALAQLEQLKELGVRLAIDDFGTGYSSLAYLSRLPVDCVKIDKSFVSDLAHDERQIAVTRAVVEIGHSFGFDTVVEGIETAEQASAARILGCTYGQGFLYGRPSPEAFSADAAVGTSAA
ncbi:MAG: putative bifunctional diguanylate cyclase/phosphodiesterase [Motilibacteraceae bacterium]